MEAKQKAGVGKVKCKEEVDKALRQYFDKGRPYSKLQTKIYLYTYTTNILL